MYFRKLLVLHLRYLVFALWQSRAFLSSFLNRSVHSENFGRNLAEHCMAPRNDFKSFGFSAGFNFTLVFTFLFGFSPFFSISCPSHLGLFMKNSVFFACSVSGFFQHIYNIKKNFSRVVVCFLISVLLCHLTMCSFWCPIIFFLEYSGYVCDSVDPFLNLSHQLKFPPVSAIFTNSSLFTVINTGGSKQSSFTSFSFFERRVRISFSDSHVTSSCRCDGTGLCFLFDWVVFRFLLNVYLGVFYYFVFLKQSGNRVNTFSCFVWMFQAI